LLPVADYEVLEVRETRTVLKAVSVQKEKGPARSSRSESAADDKQLEKKRERRRQRRRKGSEEEEAAAEEPKSEEEPKKAEEPKAEKPKTPRKRAPRKKEPDAPEQLPEPEAEPPKSFDTLIPPPAMLISERMGKYEMPEGEPAAPVVDKETPELVPPAEEKGEGFSPSRLFRRFRGSEESPPKEEE
jgi:hypothetical protein